MVQGSGGRFSASQKNGLYSHIGRSWRKFKLLRPVARALHQKKVHKKSPKACALGLLQLFT
jgi:hypothetical protein